MREELKEKVKECIEKEEFVSSEVLASLEAKKYERKFIEEVINAGILKIRELRKKIQQLKDYLEKKDFYINNLNAKIRELEKKKLELLAELKKFYDWYITETEKIEKEYVKEYKEKLKEVEEIKSELIRIEGDINLLESFLVTLEKFEQIHNFFKRNKCVEESILEQTKGNIEILKEAIRKLLREHQEKKHKLKEELKKYELTPPDKKKNSLRSYYEYARNQILEEIKRVESEISATKKDIELISNEEKIKKEIEELENEISTIKKELKEALQKL